LKSSTAPEAHSAPGDAKRHDGGRDLLRCGDPVERALRPRRLPRCTLERGTDHLGLDEPGRDARHGDAVRGQALRHRLAERVQTGLAGAVRGDVGLPPVCPSRADVDDPPDGDPVSRWHVDHLPGHAPREVRRAEQIRREGALPDLHPVLVGRELERVVTPPAPVDSRCRRHDHGGVVDEHVDPAQRGGRLRREARHGIRVGEVGGEPHVPAPRQALEHSRRPIERGRAPVVHDDPVAALGEGASNRGPHPSRCSGDEDAARRSGCGGGFAHGRHPIHAGRAGPRPRSRRAGRAGRP
jgi:hypothetical protein